MSTRKSKRVSFETRDNDVQMADQSEKSPLSPDQSPSMYHSQTTEKSLQKFELPLEKSYREYCQQEHGKDDGDVDSGCEDDDDDGESYGPGMSVVTRADIVTFICLVVATFISWLAFSIMAPFFPNEAHRRGMRDVEVGLVFSLQPLTAFIISPVIGKFIPKVGGKVTLVSGLFLEASGNILFGCCTILESFPAFVTFTFVTRIVIGLGAAASVTATMAINANTFPNHIARTVGILEMTSGVGLLLGPLVGGGLYELGGASYLLPFVAIGVMDMCSMLFSLCLLPQQRNLSEETGSVLEVLSIPASWPLILAAFVGASCLSYLEPTLSVHAHDFTQNAFYIGLLFMLFSGVYAFSSPLWGLVGEGLDITRPFVVVGLLLGTLSQILLGPSPFLHLPSQLWIICIGLMLAGFADAAIIVSSISDLFKTAVTYDLPGDLRTQGIVAGIFNSAYCLGTVFGAWVAGGLIYQTVGFEMTSEIMALVQLLTAMLVCMTSVFEHQWRKRRRRMGKPLREKYNINTGSPVPETVPLFQQPKPLSDQIPPTR